jgi:hypothetical protein
VAVPPPAPLPGTNGRATGDNAGGLASSNTDGCTVLSSTSTLLASKAAECVKDAVFSSLRLSTRWNTEA